MKTKLLLFGATLFAVLFTFSSCQKDEGDFSCDPEINEWAQANISTLRSSSYLQINQYQSAERQRTAFRMLEPNLMVQFWEDKITDVLTLNWSAKERSHLQELLKLIKENGNKWFVERSNCKSEEELENILSDFDIKTYRWKDYAIEILGWDDNLLYSIIGSPAKLKNVKGELLLSNDKMLSSVKTRSEPEPGDPDCECSITSDWCSGSTSCKSSNCHIVPVGFLPTGCGTLLYYKCDGMCEW